MCESACDIIVENGTPNNKAKCSILFEGSNAKVFPLPAQVEVHYLNDILILYYTYYYLGRELRERGKI